jgi:hypothetical protein
MWISIFLHFSDRQGHYSAPFSVFYFSFKILYDILSEKWRCNVIVIEELNPQYITDENGEKISVVLPLAKFEELLEDIEDLAAVAERREEPTIPHEDLIKELKQDGIV